MGKNKRNNKQQQNKNKQQPQVVTNGPSSTTTQPKNGTETSNNQHSTTTNNQNTNAKGIRLPSLSAQKRSELYDLVVRLLQLTSADHNSNANEEWKQYVDIQQLLQRIMAIEAPIYRAICTDASNVDDKSRLDKVSAFTQWAKSGGVQTDCLEIAIFPGYQLGLRATQDITVEQAVLTVPRKLIFSEEHFESERNSFLALSNYNLAYVLLIEKVRGMQSSWHPYIDVLPARYNTVLYFSIEQMQRLRGTAVFAAALRQCRVIARQYGAMYDMSVRSRHLPHGICYELFRWAVSTVMTRQNLVPRETQPGNAQEPNKSPLSALIPYWDMANHRPGKITSFYDSGAHQMECTAQETCKAGDQFFIYYGDRSNADLLVHNGFLDINNTKDYVQIKLGLSPTDPLLEQRAILLSHLNIKRKAELRVLPAPDYISGELLAFVRVFNMSAEQLEHWASDPERVVDLLHIDCALETDLESRTWQYLYQRLKLLLGVFEATLREADEVQQLQALQLQASSANANNEIDLMLLQFRSLERRILTDALQYAQEHCKV